MDPSPSGSPIEGYIVIMGVFVITLIITPLVVFGLFKKKKGKAFIFAILGSPIALFFLYFSGSILFAMNAVGNRRMQNESLRKAMDAIEAYYRLEPNNFIRIGNDEEVDIIGFADWLSPNQGRNGVFTDGRYPVDALKRRIRVAVDFDKDFAVDAFGGHHIVCYPDSISAKTYISGLCFLYYDETGEISWRTRSICYEEN